jgi:hypothetical protein
LVFRKPALGIGVCLAIAILCCAFAANASADPLDPASSPAPALASVDGEGSPDAGAAAAASEMPAPPTAEGAVEAVSPSDTTVPVAGEANPIQPSAEAATSPPSADISNSGGLTDRVAAAADAGRGLDSTNQAMGAVPNASAAVAGTSGSGIETVTNAVDGTAAGTLPGGPIVKQSASAVSSNLGTASGPPSGGNPQGPSSPAAGPAPAFPSAPPKLTTPVATGPDAPALGLGSQPAGSLPVSLLPYGAAGHLSFSGDSNTTAPTAPQRMPGNSPGDASGTAGGSSGGFFFFGFAVLLGLLVLAGQAVTRRVRSAAAGWRPLAFVSLLERPG